MTTSKSKTMTTEKKDLETLVKAVLKWSEMPPSGNKDWQSDFQYAAEWVVPLAERLRKKHFEPTKEKSKA